MNAAGRPRILLTTPLDYDGYRNTEHGMAYGFQHHGASVTVLYKRMNRAPQFWQMVRDTVLLRTRRVEGQGLTTICVDPFFNYYAGLRVQSDQAARGAQRFSLKALVIRLLSPLAVGRDLFFLPSFLLAARLHLRGRFDVVIGYGPWGGLVAWVLCKLGRAERFVYEDRDFEPGLVPDRLRRWYTARLEKFLVRRADVIVSIGRRLAALRRQQSGRDVHLVPTGVYPEHFAPARQRRRAGHTLVYVGNLIGWSGLEIVIRALPRLRAAHPDAQLLIAGDGLPSYRRALEQLAEELQVRDGVEFAGTVAYEDLPAFLARGDLGLANSQPVAYRKYACPLKVMECMAAGLPVVATEDTEAADIVREFAAGLVVPFDVDAFAHEVLAFWAQPERVQACAAHAAAASREFDWVRLMRRQLRLMGFEPASGAPGTGGAGECHAQVA